MKHLLISTVITTFVSVPVLAHSHPESLGGDMKHLSVSIDASNVVHVHIDPDVPTPQLRDLLPPGHSYHGNHSVLNGTAHNAQYGWLVSGFWSLPASTRIFIEKLSQSPDLKTYDGSGMGMAGDTMTPIFGTAGSSSVWEWDGVMAHNWYAVDLSDVTTDDMPLSATYSVYVGSTLTESYAEPTPGYTPGEVTLNFTAIPEPASMSALVLLGAAALRRRRA